MIQAWKPGRTAPGTVALVAMVAVVSCGNVAAGDVKDALPDFSSLSLQELANIKVTSVSKRQQKLSQVAAAVYVLTQEEIRRSGMTNVADVLRLVPGLSVARIDGSKWGVTSRGFNGRFANKLLVLVDGRSVYSPIFSGVYWDMNMPLLDTIDRIEVIRGPGGSVWGANAVSGVVNIITRSASETQGIAVTASAGSQERGSVQVISGGRMRGGAYYRTAVAAANRAALQTAEGEDARDGWSDLQASFRIDGTSRRGGWQLEGDLFHNRRREVSNLLIPETQFAKTPLLGNEPGNAGNIAFEWRRRLTDSSDLRLNSSYDYVNRPELGVTRAQTSIGNLELQFHVLAGKHHEISIGVGDRAVSDDVAGLTLVQFHPSSIRYQTASAFAQDEVHLLNDRLLLSAGAKIEHDIMGGWEVQPTARALWAPNQRHSAWVAASRVVRTPTFYEHFGDLELGAFAASPLTFGLPLIITVNGSPEIKDEVSKNYELGYRAQLSRGLSFDLSGFYTHYDNLRTAVPDPITLVSAANSYLLWPYGYNNFARGHSEGGEVSFSYRPFSRWKLAGSYSFLNLHQSIVPGAPESAVLTAYGAAPKQQVKLQSYWNVSKAVQLDVHLFYASCLTTLLLDTDVLIRQHLRGDLRLGWRVKPRWEVSFIGQDLISRRHLELTPEAFSPPTYTGRGVYVKSVWRF